MRLEKTLEILECVLPRGPSPISWDYFSWDYFSWENDTNDNKESKKHDEDHVS